MDSLLSNSSSIMITNITPSNSLTYIGYFPNGSFSLAMKMKNIIPIFIEGNGHSMPVPKCAQVLPGLMGSFSNPIMGGVFNIYLESQTTFRIDTRSTDITILLFGTLF